MNNPDKIDLDWETEIRSGQKILSGGMDEFSFFE